MTGKSGKKRKKKDMENSGGDVTDFQSVCSDSDSTQSEESQDKYKPFMIPDYNRSYPVDGGNFEYIVFMESSDPNKPIGDRDMMSLGQNLKKFNKGIKQLQRINKYKIGVIFERPGLANQALTNKKFLDINKLKASIPAAASETTGVIQNVPHSMSNEHIYNNITSSKNIVCIRRFMKRVKVGNEFQFQPTKTISITFSCPVLPESVDLHSWRFEVRPYIPPVKQCLRCLRYGHIAKFCKNAERCSICGKDHSFKVCTVSTKDAVCCHCNGNHIAISSTCPIKQQKITENRNKVTAKSITYAEQLNKSFPSLIKNPPNPSDQLISLLNSEQILTSIVEAFIKLMSAQKSNEKAICTQSIKETLLDTLKIKKLASS